MKKIINQPQDVVSEMLDGLTYAYGDLIEKVPDFVFITLADCLLNLVQTTLEILDAFNNSFSIG